MVKIIKNLVAADQRDLKCPHTMTPTCVVIHNTANDASAANEVAYMRRNSQQVSFHYAVDDKQIVQGIEENRNAWHAGDGGNGTGNRKGIAIEICYSKSGGAKFDAAEKNAAEFAASLLKKYGWGINRLKKHQDFNGKRCPHRTLDKGWDRFVKMVEGYLNPAKTTKKSVEAIAKDVIAGKYGNGEERKKKLKAEGYDPAAVQAKVNQLLSGATSTKTAEKTSTKKSVEAIARDVIAGKYGNGEERKKRLKAEGYDPAAVQDKVNQLLA